MSRSAVWLLLGLALGPASSLLAQGEGNVEVLAGINLPILVKLASLRRDMTLHDAVAAARDAGRKYIKVASQELTGES